MNWVIEMRGIPLTAGKFAKRAGVTLRTIRYYDEKGLLTPSEHSDSGYRLYNEADFARLQKILTLKYLGFSLEDIKAIIEKDVNYNNFKSSLDMQKRALEDKIRHMSKVAEAITEAEVMLENAEELDWGSFVNIIKTINMENEWVKQFKDSSNLNKRISLHDKFSTNKYGWHRWVFDRIKFFKGARILELGCGDGSLWAKNIDRIPQDCEIILSDISSGMLEDARKKLGEHSEHFSFKVLDAQNICIEDAQFDIVIGNHLLYYVNRRKACNEIKRVLKPKGYFYTSTLSMNHLIEIADIAKEFDKRINLSQVSTAGEFGLENGMQQLEEWFGDISLHKYEDSLLVDEAKPLADFVLSAPGVSELVSTEARIEELREVFSKRISSNKNIFVTKESGIFEARKLS
jgi:DNA-binding transcriptional MerR regulator